MIVCYTTEGYVEWAEVFLKSFNMFHKKEKIHINGWNISKKNIKNLKSLYKNLTIDNDESTIENLSKKLNISIDDLLKSKENCESGKKIGGIHRDWMNVTADGLRIEKLYETILKYPNEDYFLHMDIDLLFRDNIKKYISLDNGDVGLKFRKNKNYSNTKINDLNLDLSKKGKDSIINIGTVFIKNNENGIYFTKKWKEIINSVSLKEKSGIKWGQYAIAESFMKTKNKVSFFRFENDVFSPSCSKTAPVWFFKTKDKQKSYNEAIDELKRLKNERN